ncbi:hypothetical protein ACH40E_43960 [Streptomyces acidicola]|uniref:hypothetical protein n=1 Tax=Streptomyces acidicola TaxID=2596892 RepID=UPI003795A4B7
MPALSARHIASSALCAALLVGITGPAAVAADSARERSPAASSNAWLYREDALLTEVRKIDGGELAPVADLLDAVLKADDGRLPPDEARRLGDAAKRALAEASAKAPAPSATPTATAPATSVLPEAPSAPASDELDEVGDALDDVLDQVGEVLDDVVKAVDELLEALASSAGEVLPQAGDLLTALTNLVKGLLGSGLEGVTSSDPAVSSTQTSTSTSTATPPASPVTLPVITPLLEGLLSIL